jgi:hypothetical protein
VEPPSARSQTFDTSGSAWLSCRVDAVHPSVHGLLCGDFAVPDLGSCSTAVCMPGQTCGVRPVRRQRRSCISTQY